MNIGIDGKTVTAIRAWSLMIAFPLTRFRRDKKIRKNAAVMSRLFSVRCDLACYHFNRSLWLNKILGGLVVVGFGVPEVLREASEFECLRDIPAPQAARLHPSEMFWIARVSCVREHVHRVLKGAASCYGVGARFCENLPDGSVKYHILVPESTWSASLESVFGDLAQLGGQWLVNKDSLRSFTLGNLELVKLYSDEEWRSRAVANLWSEFNGSIELRIPMPEYPRYLQDLKLGSGALAELGFRAWKDGKLSIEMS